MTYGLKEDTIASINEVFQRFPDVEQAILYGSRAMDRQRYNSDIDMTLIGPNLNMSILLQIETALDDLILPYKIDLSIFHNIDNAGLMDHIKRVGKVFFEREKAAIY